MWLGAEGNSQYFTWGCRRRKGRARRVGRRAKKENKSEERAQGMRHKSKSVQRPNHKDQGVKSLELRCWQGCDNLLILHKKRAQQK